ncbi:MAG: PAS domain S-box protein [bacterium]|nr:PAS domain S-box protein [bacterium]
MSEQFIKNNPQPIYIYDKESLRFLAANDAALELYGYSTEEFLQLDLTDLYTSEDIQHLLEASHEIFRDGQFSKPFKHRKKDGNYLTVRMSRIEYQYEGIDSYLNVLQDVSNLTEHEQKKQIFKAAFDNTSDMIFVTDPQGIITYANESVLKLLGVTSNEILNTDITLNCGEEDKVFINDSVFHSHIKETVNFTIELITSEGRLLESEVVSTPVFDINNNVESFVLIARPTVELKSNSTKAKVDNTELPVGENSIKTEKPDSDKNYIDSTFLSGLFHEILTPMNVILGFTQELVESIDNPSPEQKEALDIINQNRASILGLMNTIIEFADIQYNKMEAEITEIPVTEVIENYEKNLNEITGIRDIEFAYGKISSSLRFGVDKKKLMNLFNIIFRLIGRISSQKKLYFSAYPVDNNTFNISISDGFGKSTPQLVDTLKSLFLEKQDPKSFNLSKLTVQIVNTLLEKLHGKLVIVNENTDKRDVAFNFPINFTPKVEAPVQKEPEKFVFSSSENKTQTKSKTEGAEKFETEPQLNVEESESQLLNLGEELIIEEIEISDVKKGNKKKAVSNDNVPALNEQVNKIEEMVESKAEVAVEEKAEEIVMEEKSEIVKEQPIPQQNKNGLSSLRCLYIEDQVDSQILFKVQMKDLKNIQFAASFEEALPLLDSTEFDFIIMDINLQGEYNGLDALKVIHQIPKFKNIPVIAVTAYVLPGDKEKFIATGFTDFISKPIFRDKLVESLNKIFVN